MEIQKIMRLENLFKKPKVVLIIGEKKRNGRGRKGKGILFVEEIYKVDEIYEYCGIGENEEIKLYKKNDRVYILETEKYKLKILDLENYSKEEILKLISKFLDRKFQNKISKKGKLNLIKKVFDEVGYETDFKTISEKELLWGFVSLSQYIDYRMKKIVS